MEKMPSASGGATVQAGYFHKQEPKAKMLVRNLMENNPLEQAENPAVYSVPITEKCSDLGKGFRKYTFGEERVKVNEKFILMVGETSSGKSTLINAMMNYVLGVEFGDEFRFKLIDEVMNKSQAHSQTSTVTAYEIQSEPGLRLCYPITLIDTPGFGDTRGLNRDKQTVEQLTACFSSPHFIAHLNVVCFVIKASSPRLTPTQRYIFNSVLSIFGKDIAENVVFMLTFADYKPLALSAIKEASLPGIKGEDGTVLHYSFNNGGLFDKTDISEAFWKMSMGSMKSFFDQLEYLGPKSLVLTKEVLKERALLDATLQVLVPEIKAGLATLQTIKNREKALKENLDKMEENKNFSVELAVIVSAQEPIDKKSALNCEICDVTCHYPCRVVARPFNYFCEVIDKSGNCKVCPGECKARHHKLENHKWVTSVMVQKEELKDMKEQYESAYKGVKTEQQILEKMEEESAAVNLRVVQYIEKATKCVARLREIALMPEQIDCSDFIDVMIKNEEMAGEPGFQDRISNLKKFKEYTEILKKVERNEELLPEEAITHKWFQELTNKLPAAGIKYLLLLRQKVGKYATAVLRVRGDDLQ